MNRTIIYKKMQKTKNKKQITNLLKKGAKNGIWKIS